jgi:hypothetical protein
MKWKEDMAQNTSVRIAVRVGGVEHYAIKWEGLLPNKGKKKIKCTLLQAVRLDTGCTAHRGGGVEV